MRNFKEIILLVTFVTITILNYSCSKDFNTSTAINDNQITQNRSIACPNLDLSLVRVLGPCASLKLVYNGTDDPNSTCNLLKFDIKTFKVWDYNEIKTFNSPFNNFGNGIFSNWISTLDGGLVNLAGGPDLGVFNIQSPITDVNGSFEYFIQSDPHLGDRTWICVDIILDCNGEECRTTKCFNAYTPCI